MDNRIIFHSAWLIARFSYWVFDRIELVVKNGKVTIFIQEGINHQLHIDSKSLGILCCIAKWHWHQVKELNRKSHPVAFWKHLSDGYYVSVKNNFYHVDYFVPYGLEVNQLHPSKSGITTHINKWVQLCMQIIPAIHWSHPAFGSAKHSVDGKCSCGSDGIFKKLNEAKCN